ncbi:MAG: methyltransferase domain-containing protein [Alphaproteobacteria bacterium]|nr:methyltransferase domain-containing protein [Alphaproteobacteria bacterium]
MSNNYLENNISKADLHIIKGNEFYKNKKYIKAIEEYKKAIELDSDYALPYNNLAGVYYELNDVENGFENAKKATEKDINSWTAWLHLGNFTYLKNDYNKAIEYYDIALSRAADDDSKNIILSNKASSLLELEKIDEAEEIFIDLEEINPNQPDILLALAQIAEKRNQYEQASLTYLRLLKVQNDPVNHISLGNCLYCMMMENIDISNILSLWLEGFPDNAQALHTKKTFENLKSEKREQGLRASKEYVKELFDAFAESFDGVLKELEYKAPYEIAKAAMPYLNKKTTVLDLGCGTGLCGREILKIQKPKKLIGIDLSSNMIEKAKKFNVYDDFVIGDITSFKLRKKFDLITSADVMTYIGDLKDVFKNAYNHLNKGGIFIFSTSTTENNSDSFEMEMSGRFTHGINYIKSLAKNLFEIIDIKRVILRKENNKEVLGVIAVYKKID